MTIYLIRWVDKDDNMPYNYACSSFTAAQKKLKEINKDPQLKVIQTPEGEPIFIEKPKTQADVINLINSL